jgi:hypothetical protein
MNYIQIRTEGEQEKQEILISTLTSLGAIGFEQKNTYLLSYFNEEDFMSYDVNKALEEEFLKSILSKKKTGMKNGRKILNLCQWVIFAVFVLIFIMH